MSTSASASLTRCVISSSAWLGSAMPEGWLWATITAAELRLQGELDDLARMHARAVDGAAEQLLEVHEAVTLVEVKAAEHLVLEIPQLGAQEIPGRLRACEARAGSQRLRQLPPGDLGGSLQLGKARGPQARLGAKARPVGGDQLAQGSKAREHLAREVECRAPALFRCAAGWPGAPHRRARPRLSRAISLAAARRSASPGSP